MGTIEMNIDWKGIRSPVNLKWEKYHCFGEQISQILNSEGYYNEDKFLELVRLKFPYSGEDFYEKYDNLIAKRYSESEYISLESKPNKVLSIEMMQVPWKWEEAMLDIMCYALANGYGKIIWKIQPQKKSSERRKKILLDKWISFGATSRNGTDVEIDLTDENIGVLNNKVKYYLEKGKWFNSK